MSKGESGFKDYQKGRELYSRFVEGGSYEIHRLFGMDIMTGEPTQADIKAMRAMESVFSPTKTDLQVYKGLPITEEGLDIIRQGEMTNQLISSTSKSKVTAQSYSVSDDEDESVTPLLMNITIKKGVKVADTQEILGTDGMKGFEQEVTVWKGTKWKFSNLRENVTRYGDTSYTVDVIVE